MKIKVDRIDGLFHFVGKDANGTEVHMDASETIGGTDKGIRPMQMLLYGLAGCSGIDVVSILNKQKQTIDGISIEIEAEREKDKQPSLFTEIHVRFILKGKIDEIKAQKALDLTFDKYCSVAKTLDQYAKITYSFSIN